MIDTLDQARVCFPGAKANLNALCKRFGIGLDERENHGALIDSRLLAKVYLELFGGRQRELGLLPAPAEPQASDACRTQRASPIIRPTEEELAAHALLVAKLTNPLWHTGTDVEKNGA